MMAIKIKPKVKDKIEDHDRDDLFALPYHSVGAVILNLHCKRRRAFLEYELKAIERKVKRF